MSDLRRRGGTGGSRRLRGGRGHAKPMSQSFRCASPSPPGLRTLFTPSGALTRTSQSDPRHDGDGSRSLISLYCRAPTMVIASSSQPAGIAHSSQTGPLDVSSAGPRSVISPSTSRARWTPFGPATPTSPSTPQSPCSGAPKKKKKKKKKKKNREAPWSCPVEPRTSGQHETDKNEITHRGGATALAER